MSDQPSEKAVEAQRRSGSPLLWKKMGPEAEADVPEPQEDVDDEQG